MSNQQSSIGCNTGQVGGFARALGAPLAPLLYGFGFLAVAAGAVGFNALALLALRKLQKSQMAMVS